MAEYYTKITGIEVTRSDAFWLKLDPSKHVVMIEKNANK
jgi:phage anti-repressor protein